MEKEKQKEQATDNRKEKSLKEKQNARLIFSELQNVKQKVEEYKETYR